MKKLIALIQLPFVGTAVGLLVLCGIVPPDELVRVLTELMSESGQRWIAALKKPASDTKQLPPSVPQAVVSSEPRQVAEQKARADAKELGMGAKTTMGFVQEVRDAVDAAMPKSATQMFNDADLALKAGQPQVAKAPAAPTKKPKVDQKVVGTAIVHRDKVEKRPAPPIQIEATHAPVPVMSNLPRVDVNAKTVAKPSVQQGDVSPEDVLALQELLRNSLIIPRHGWRPGYDHDKATEYCCPVPNKDASASTRAEFVEEARNVIGWMKRYPEAKQHWEYRGWSIQRLEAVIADLDPAGVPHLDPTPTVARGVDVLAIAEAEIAAKRASAPLPRLDPKRLITSGGTTDMAERIHAGCAHAVYRAATGREDSAKYIAGLPPIPAFAAPWSERFSIAFLTDLRFVLSVEKALELAGVELSHLVNPKHLTTGDRSEPYWSYCQPGSTYLATPVTEVLDRLVGKDEKPLTVLEVACLLIQYPWVIPDTLAAGIDCLGLNGQPFTICRRMNGSLVLDTTDIYVYGENIGMATRGSTTGIVDMSDVRVH